MKKQRASLKFTDADVRNMKTDKRLQDNLEGGGFGIRVYNSGTKVFYHAYTFDGKRRFLNLGEYPIVSLADARKRYNASKKKIEMVLTLFLKRMQQRPSASVLRLFLIL